LFIFKLNVCIQPSGYDRPIITMPKLGRYRLLINIPGLYSPNRPEHLDFG
jgi:hypothetical protein